MFEPKYARSPRYVSLFSLESVDSSIDTPTGSERVWQGSP